MSRHLASVPASTAGRGPSGSLRPLARGRAAARRRALLPLAVLIVACGSHKAPNPTLQSISVTPDGYSVEQGVQLQATATGHYSDGTTKDITATAVWASSSPGVATVAAGRRVFTVGTGSTKLTAASDGKVGAATLTVTPRRSFPLATVGLVLEFEQRGGENGYWAGDLLHDWNDMDPVVGHTVADEAKLQLDTLEALGVNVIAYELSAADAAYIPGPVVPPTCNLPPTLGVIYPQPAASDLANLKALLDELQKRGMKMWLSLNNTHMEEQPPTNNTTWLTAILQAVGNHPALDLITFGGATHTVNTSSGPSCGSAAEPALWTGPGAVQPAYVEWALRLGLSLGIPARKLSAEAVVGDYNTTTSWPNTSGDFTDNHFWWPITTLKAIFDDLGVAPADRTYALSFYQHQKCMNLFPGEPCTEGGPHAWADETVQAIIDAVGSESRIVPVEMGDNPPVDPTWTADHALESLARVMQAHHLEGGAYWHWVGFGNGDDTDPAWAGVAVKRRGVAFTYNPVERVLADLGGWHVSGIQNGSFESGSGHWTSGGSGSVAAYDLTAEPNQPEVPWRGTHALRLTTGPGAMDTVTATSDRVAVEPAVAYTTTANLRFTSADAKPTATISLLYFQASGMPSKVRAADSFVFHESDGPGGSGFGTFPVQYVPPADAALAAVQFSIARGGSSMAATLDVDDVR